MPVSTTHWSRRSSSTKDRHSVHIYMYMVLSAGVYNYSKLAALTLLYIAANAPHVPRGRNECMR